MPLSTVWRQMKESPPVSLDTLTRLEIVGAKTYRSWSSTNQESATECDDTVVCVGTFFMAVCVNS